MTWFKTKKPVQHLAYAPAHACILPAHGPRVPVGFFMVLPLPMVSAEDYGRVLIDEVYNAPIYCSRS